MPAIYASIVLGLIATFAGMPQLWPVAIVGILLGIYAIVSHDDRLL